MKVLDEAAEKFAGTHYIPKNQGVAFIGKREFDKAIDYLTRSLAVAPDYDRALRARCEAYVLKGEPSRGLPDCERAVAVQNTVPENYDARALARLSVQDIEGAKADLTMAKSLDANRPDVETRLAELEQRLQK